MPEDAFIPRRGKEASSTVPSPFLTHVPAYNFDNVRHECVFIGCRRKNRLRALRYAIVGRNCTIGCSRSAFHSRWNQQRNRYRPSLTHAAELLARYDMLIYARRCANCLVSRRTRGLSRDTRTQYRCRQFVLHLDLGNRHFLSSLHVTRAISSGRFLGTNFISSRRHPASAFLLLSAAIR